jgi:hypothetical protein
MRAVEAIVVLAVVGGALLWLGQRTVRRVFERRRLRHAPWSLEETSDGELLTYYAARPGQERLMVGAVAFGSDEFDFKVEELRSRALQKVAALNSGGRLLGR